MSPISIYEARYLPATQEANDEDDYSDILTGVTDADEAYADQCEAAAATEHLMRSLKRFDSFDLAPKETGGPSSTTKMRTRSTATLEPVQEDKQLVYASFWGASEYVELLFDAETPLASDEDLALRSIFAPGSMPEPVTRLNAHSHDKPSPTPELLDTSHLKIRPTLAVHEFCDKVSETLDVDVSPVMEQVQNTRYEITLSRQGRSLVHSHSPIVAGKTSTEEFWQLEDDPVLRYATGRTVLPGMDHLRNVTARSVTIRYDHDIEDLFHATISFLDDCHDGECTCLDGKMHSLRVPGENFMLADNDDEFGFSVRRPTAKDIFQSIDEVINADMFDVYDDNGGIPEEVLPLPGAYFDTTPQNVEASMVLDRLLYPSALDAVSSLVGDREGVSDVSDTDLESLPLTQHLELTYVDADTNQCIAYTALNQLLAMEEGGVRQVIHRDIPDEDDEPEIGLAEVVYLHPTNGGRGILLPPPNSSNLNRSSFDFNSGISRPPAQLQPDISLQSTVRQRCEPYGLYSSNRSRHQRGLPRLRLATQLLPKHKPLPMVEEEEQSCCSSSSSVESLDFADHRGFVKPLEDRRLGFLDDDDEGPDDSESPVTPTSTPDCIYENLFTDAVWDTTPDLTLAQPSKESYVTIALASGLPPSPLLEVFEIEIHSRLAFMFNCMVSGCSDNELRTLSNDLHWTLCVLANDYPALAFLDSLGAAVEILVERMIGSTIAS